jgi:hypothetical protein
MKNDFISKMYCGVMHVVCWLVGGVLSFDMYDSRSHVKYLIHVNQENKLFMIY